MGAPIRFLFDNDFATPPPPVVAVPDAELEEEVPKIELELHLLELKRAEEAAYERGLAEGQQNAQAEVHEQLTRKTQRMGEAADKMIALIDGDLKRIEADAMVLTATIAKKIAGFALKNYSDDQIMGLIGECLAPLRNVRHLAIRVNEAFVDRLKEPIESLAAKNGFEGRLLILGEPETQPGDCRIEWADGGILFERAAVVAAVDTAIMDHLGEEAVEYEPGLELPSDAEPEPEPDTPDPDANDDEMSGRPDMPDDAEEAGFDADDSLPGDGTGDDSDGDGEPQADAPGFESADMETEAMDPTGEAPPCAEAADDLSGAPMGDDNVLRDDRLAEAADPSRIEPEMDEPGFPNHAISEAEAPDNGGPIGTAPDITPENVGSTEDER